MTAISKGRKAQSGEVGTGSPSDCATNRRAALGIRCHSGWAAAILLCSSGNDMVVLDRRRVELCDNGIEGAKQPFHHAESMAFAGGEAFIARCRSFTDALATAAIGKLVEAAAQRNSRVCGCSVLSASGRKLPSLKEILASHALIHAAEGEFYRDAVASACAHAGLAVLRIRERDVLRQASDHTGLPEAKLSERLNAIGKSLGPPWTADQKLATLAAWIALG